MDQVRHCWHKQAAKWHTPLLEVKYTPREVARIWDMSCFGNERIIIASPLFVPLPSAWDELEYLRGEKQLLVGLKEYDPVWTLKHTAQDWDECGLSRHCLVLQLAGQTKITLPPSTKIGSVFKWSYKSPRSTVYNMDGYHSGRLSVRYRVGEVYRDPFGPGGESRAWGRDILDRPRMYTKKQCYNEWASALEGWSKWLKN